MQPKILGFEDIISWQKATALTLDLFKIFEHNKNYSFKDQIQRASVSIANNIAEGFERGSNKDFTKFLYIAKGSSAEVRSMLYLAKEMKYIDKKQFDTLFLECQKISKLISGLIKALNK